MWIGVWWSLCHRSVKLIVVYYFVHYFVTCKKTFKTDLVDQKYDNCWVFLLDLTLISHKYCLYRIHLRELQLNATKYWSFFAGNNCELSTSYCESANEVKGDPPACHNGGTCLPDENSFTCSCAPGFTGTVLLSVYFKTYSFSKVMQSIYETLKYHITLQVLFFYNPYIFIWNLVRYHG